LPRHFAVVAPPFPSHVRAIEALVAPLLDRGARVSWLHQADVRGQLRDPRIGFVALGAGTHPAGSLQGVIARAASPRTPWGLRRVIDDMAAATRMLCDALPAALERIGADAVLADQMEAAGALVAGALRLPHVALACALPVHRERGLPLPVLPFLPSGGEPRAQRVLDEAERVHDWLMGPLHATIAREALRFGLGPRRTLADLASPLAQLSQTTAGFDFPRAAPPVALHHTGPWRPAASTHTALHWPAHAPRREGAPLAFASLGTLQGHRLGLWRRIVHACRAEGMQLVVAHCGRLDARGVRQLQRDGADWVTDFVPQPALIAQADVVITHGGLNTVMDALAAGKPLLVLPLAFDQPGVAARVAFHGTGLRLLPVLARAGTVRHALRRLLREPAFAQRARALGAEVRAAGGAPRGAALAEAAVAARHALANDQALEMA
jgi:zeaxanthin glucosyltransferase